MSRLLEEYGRLFKQCLSSNSRIDPFFLDSALLPGTKSEIRYELLARLRQQPVEARQTAAPIVWFLAHFIDEYDEIEQELPAFFDEVNARMRAGTSDAEALLALLETLLAHDGGPADEAALSFALKFGVVVRAYSSARERLNHDLEALGVLRTQ